jgi:hypothetical protein
MSDDQYWHALRSCLLACRATSVERFSVCYWERSGFASFCSAARPSWQPLSAFPPETLKTDSPMEYPMTTENRVHSGWRPTKGTCKLRATAPARFTDYRLRIAREGEPFPD